MSWSALLAALGLATAAVAINRPVYKVVLTQKGFTQFLQYDVEIPPIREFTFCTWLKVHGFQNEQSIFTYMVNGNNRVVRLWLDSGGHYIKVLFNEKELSSVVVELGQDVWRHLCLSYQSDFGAWALYLDSRLISCEASQNLLFFVIPGGGSVILGYGTIEQGSSTGLEGEIFGANMILTSTIGKNHSLSNHPQLMQRTFERNKISGYKNIDYVVLNNLDAEESPNVAKETKLPPKLNKPKSFIKVRTPYSFIEHDTGVRYSTMKPAPNFDFPVPASQESEILDIVMNRKPSSSASSLKIINTVTRNRTTGQFKVQSGNEQSSADTHDLPMVSEFETPPPPHSTRSDYSHKNNNEVKSSKLNDVPAPTKQSHKNIYNIRYQDQLSELDVPPPPAKDSKVYGQWTSSKYAGSVLNYLKSINYYKKGKKVPTTIPLTKISDNFPYASNLYTRVVRPPTNIKRKNMLAEQRLPSQYKPASLNRIHKIHKRETALPQINVKILEDDIRSEILQSHANTQAMNVEVTNRGESQKKIGTNPNRLRFIRNFDSEFISYKPHYFNTDHSKTSSMFNVLPFLKSFEYFTEESDTDSAKNDMYAKIFTVPNKWHNIKTYNNDYTPRRVPSMDGYSDLDQHIAEANKKNPAIRLKYKPETNKIIHQNNDEPMIKGRKLALDVSNQSENNKDSVSILKYNHGFLPGHSEAVNRLDSKSQSSEINKSKTNFHKHVKIGNALNEKNVIGLNEEQNKNSFLGGDEKIPDIQRYRSDIDNEKQKVPPSLKPRVCKNVELLDHLLYVHPDGSIHMSRIVSPLKTKNVALEFIVHNYKKCSLDDSFFKDNMMLLINWSKTPVRLFGGAVAKRTKDLCGFFE